MSVVVVSNGRAASLPLCLTALGQLQYHPFEIVVVADAEGRSAVAEHPLAGRLRLVAFDGENIAKARNLGIEAAAGDIVAFIDDDAAAEPDWLGHLAAAFSDPGVAAAGGFVLGRNGISLQWGARQVDREGWHRDLPLDTSRARVFDPPAAGAIRTEGTCMAVRRSVLIALGGFDTRFRFYLDDTDLDLRLASAGHRVAIVPEARVWHWQAASARRTASRVPLSLREIGASLAVFLAEHAGAERAETALRDHRETEFGRLVHHMVAGRLVPEDVARLLRGFDAGIAEGRGRIARPFEPSGTKTPFLSVQERPPHSERVRLSGWAWQREALMQAAERHVAEGALVHLILFTPSTLYHRRRFVAPGLWLQSGGLFGRSDRTTSLYRSWSLADRSRHEWETGPLARPVPFDAAT